MKTIQIKKNSEVGGYDLVLSYDQPPYNGKATQNFNIKTLKRSLCLLKRHINNGYEFVY